MRKKIIVGSLFALVFLSMEGCVEFFQERATVPKYYQIQTHEQAFKPGCVITLEPLEQETAHCSEGEERTEYLKKNSKSYYFESSDKSNETSE